jgi:hypothetical protein
MEVLAVVGIVIMAIGNYIDKVIVTMVFKLHMVAAIKYLALHTAIGLIQGPITKYFHIEDTGKNYNHNTSLGL